MQVIEQGLFWFQNCFGGFSKLLFSAQILRQAFDDASDPYLPEEVLWRQKEQFSDGVGYGWYVGHFFL